MGDTLQIRGRFQSGTNTADEAQLGLPSGLSIKSGEQLQNCGVWLHNATSDTNGGVMLMTGGDTYLNFGSQKLFSADSYNSFSPVAGTDINSSVTMGFFAEVPIEGWSSSQQLSDDADTRVVAAEGRLSADQGISTSSDTAIEFDTIVKDTHSAFDSSTYKYIAPLSGWYQVQGTAEIESLTDGTYQYLKLYKDSTLLDQDRRVATAYPEAYKVHALTWLDAGDGLWLKVANSSDSSYNINYDQGLTTFRINRVSGPSQIAANELISAIYETNTGASLASNSTTRLDFDTKVQDTHGAVTTGASWSFTAPVSGTYHISAILGTANLAWGTGEELRLIVYKNGSTEVFLNRIEVFTAGSFIMDIGGANSVVLDKGDTIDLRVWHNRGGGAITVLTDVRRNRLSIHRIGF